VLADDRTLYDVIVSGIVLLAVGWALFFLARALQRGRPGLNLTGPLLLAMAVRLGAVALFAGVGALSHARGPDENVFFLVSHGLADDFGALGRPPGALVGNLQLWIMAVQLKLFGDVSDIPPRLAMVGIAVAGIPLFAAAVSDVASPRAGTLAAWLLALEPSGVFFAGLLHKEAGLYFAEGLVAFGAVRMYVARDLQAGVLLVAGVVVAGLGRSYVGAALGVAAVAVTFHSARRRIGPSRARAPRLAAGAAVLAVLAALVVVPRPGVILDQLDRSQTANARGASNLRLEPVDFSTPQGVAVNLPRRIRDLLTRPYPWQVSNTNQRLGVIGTVVAWLLFALVLILLLRQPRDALRRLAPLLYVLAAVVVAYALSTGNAGTGFRYRTHVLAILLVVSCALLPERFLRVPRLATRVRSQPAAVR
jgi:hypothetical protein